MKKGYIWIILGIVAVIVVYRFISKSDPKPQEQKEEALSQGKNSSRFNFAFGEMMGHYYALKDAFVDWDTTRANAAALALSKSADSLPLQEIKADTTLVETAGNYVSSITAELKGLVGENNIEAKRKSFNMLTSEIYDLIRTVKYDGETVYHDKCPMAFADSIEAYWLSNQAMIVNPYLGKYHPEYKDKMLGCGEVVDSLHFAAQ